MMRVNLKLIVILIFSTIVSILINCLATPPVEMQFNVGAQEITKKAGEQKILQHEISGNSMNVPLVSRETQKSQLKWLFLLQQRGQYILQNIIKLVKQFVFWLLHRAPHKSFILTKNALYNLFKYLLLVTSFAPMKKIHGILCKLSKNVAKKDSKGTFRDMAKSDQMNLHRQYNYVTEREKENRKKIMKNLTRKVMSHVDISASEDYKVIRLLIDFNNLIDEEKYLEAQVVIAKNIMLKQASTVSLLEATTERVKNKYGKLMEKMVKIKSYIEKAKKTLKGIVATNDELSARVSENIRLKLLNELKSVKSVISNYIQQVEDMQKELTTIVYPAKAATELKLFRLKQKRDAIAAANKLASKEIGELERVIKEINIQLENSTPLTQELLCLMTKAAKDAARRVYMDEITNYKLDDTNETDLACQLLHQGLSEKIVMELTNLVTNGAKVFDIEARLHSHMNKIIEECCSKIYRVFCIMTMKDPVDHLTPLLRRLKLDDTDILHLKEDLALFSCLQHGSYVYERIRIRCLRIRNICMSIIEKFMINLYGKEKVSYSTCTNKSSDPEVELKDKSSNWMPCMEHDH